MISSDFPGKVVTALEWAREQDKEWHSTGVHARAIGNLWPFLDPLGIKSAVEIGSGSSAGVRAIIYQKGEHSEQLHVNP